MRSIRRVIGFSLIGVSLLAVVQTAREIGLWLYGERRFEERSLQAQRIDFGGHRVVVTDDQPTDSVVSRAESPGAIQPTIDGHALGSPSRAAVRRGLRDLGRYHGWYDAWIFRDRASADSILYLTRRMQPQPSDAPRFEITTINGSTHLVQQRLLTGWQLAWSFPIFRSTQFIRDDSWSVLPLSVPDLLGLFPIAVLVFPLGTAVVGFLLIRRTGLSGP